MNAEEQAVKESLLREYEAQITEAFRKSGHTLSEMEDAVTEVGKEMNHALLEKLVSVKKRAHSCQHVRNVDEH